MQDRFKFRVWETDQKIMKDCTQITLDKDQTGSMCDVKGKVTAHLVYQPHYIVMQCTGLKDKNGKLIYEGDIVKANYITPIGENKEKICTIEFNRCAFWIHYDSFASYLANEECEYEIVGNIYENKDLLNE